MKHKELRESLKPALEWLKDFAPQNRGAHISHHSISRVNPVGKYSVRVVPKGANGKPVVVFDIIEKQYNNASLTNGFTQEECDSLVESITELWPVSDTWNGAVEGEKNGCGTFSVELEGRAADAILKLVDNRRESTGSFRLFSSEYTAECKKGRELARIPEEWW